jgi:hypothetical protein
VVTAGRLLVHSGRTAQQEYGTALQSWQFELRRAHSSSHTRQNLTSQNLMLLLRLPLAKRRRATQATNTRLIVMVLQSLLPSPRHLHARGGDRPNCTTGDW